MKNVFFNSDEYAESTASLSKTKAKATIVSTEKWY